MCGIFGYVGSPGASNTILTGLKRLEYRGYDSWGIAVKHNGSIDMTKQVGAIGDIDLSNKLNRACIGIGHTRWATHGGTTVNNAHPHIATDGSFVLAQNGIVENYQHLKAEFEKKGYSFVSETDTEVIVRLIEDTLKTTRDLTTAVREAFLTLTGRNTIIVLSADSDRIIAVRNGSPLVVGIGDDEFFFSSDTLSFADKTSSAVLLENHEMVKFDNGKLTFVNVMTGKAFDPQIQTLDHTTTTIDKEGYDHYMLKEIVEQRDTIREAVQYDESEFAPLVNAIHNAKSVYTVGAGTAGFAAGQIAYFLRTVASVNAVELKSYETLGFENHFAKGDVLIAVSQSGETADTIEAVEKAKSKGVAIASIVNMMGSSLIRLSDHAFLTRSGPEICVASTKAYTAQLSWGLVLAFASAGKFKDGVSVINRVSKQISGYFTDELFSRIKGIASGICSNEHFFVLGKGQHYYTALEGALKIKEITYKHVEGFAAGELKHGVIALIEKGTPVFVIVGDDEHRADMYTVAAEVKSRGAYVIGVADRTSTLFDDMIPSFPGGIADPAVKIIGFQLLSYFLGVALGNNVDKPRNLAKSVTVK
ncbi:MAG: glutamine--fructose-6-phosphate transaminase (isomerizing) [Candidatus Dojkabacteria bacterium]|nr:glutamine--fructose-6-phosphate transaminase (isomerizing) [Candidatus Dojkabacteria bacterium]